MLAAPAAAAYGDRVACAGFRVGAAIGEGVGILGCRFCSETLAMTRLGATIEAASDFFSGVVSRSCYVAEVPLPEVEVGRRHGSVMRGQRAAR